MAIDNVTNTIVLAAYNNVKTFVFNAQGAWEEIPEILYSNDDGSNIHVALNNNTLVLGIDKSNQNYGTALVYEYNNNAWNHVQTLTNDNSQVNQRFGNRVAIYNNFIAVSAYYYSVNSETEAGAVYVFKKDNGVWSQTPTAIINAVVPTPYDYFGSNITMYDNKLVVASYKLNYGIDVTSAYYRTGKCYHYYYNGSEWVIGSVIDPPTLEKDSLFGDNMNLNNSTLIVTNTYGVANNTFYLYVLP